MHLVQQKRRSGETSTAMDRGSGRRWFFYGQIESNKRKINVEDMLTNRGGEQRRRDTDGTRSSLGWMMMWKIGSGVLGGCGLMIFIIIFYLFFASAPPFDQKGCLSNIKNWAPGSSYWHCDWLADGLNDMTRKRRRRRGCSRSSRVAFGMIIRGGIN